ncbi:MAG: hypothetical protein ACSLE0_13570 [Chitinophagaceae bacterium]
MMYGELYQYFILHKQLNIPGIGTFFLERKPASIDFVNKIADPPFYTIALHHGNSDSSKNILGWLAATLNISERDALNRFNDFALDLKNKVLSGDQLQWSGIGTLSKGMAGEIRFEASLKDMKAGTSVPAIKVMRENAEHKVRVGEEQKTSTQMMEWLAPTDEKKSNWWGIALIVGLLAFIFIAIYFSTKGFNSSSAANQQKLTPKKENTTYKIPR